MRHTQILPPLDLVDVLCHLPHQLPGRPHRLIVWMLQVGSGLNQLVQKQRVLQYPLNWLDDQRLEVPRLCLSPGGREGGREGTLLTGVEPIQQRSYRLISQEEVSTASLKPDEVQRASDLLRHTGVLHVLQGGKTIARKI